MRLAKPWQLEIVAAASNQAHQEQQLAALASEWVPSCCLSMNLGCTLVLLLLLVVAVQLMG